VSSEDRIGPKTEQHDEEWHVFVQSRDTRDDANRRGTASEPLPNNSLRAAREAIARVARRLRWPYSPV